ncbi:Pyridoxal-dependent decarboxylase domain-containing protein 1 [Taenia crassiceps]|uniref:Pyridoxal-dependent decarboxylase domain-containing protein 1 n=1 Tax=Taenia crassiceps TaxID=6207 RepID=A0ABR4Q775_9CEST
MEPDLRSLLTELLTQTLGRSLNSELEKVRSIIPETSVQLQKHIAQADFLLHRLEEKHRQKITACILGDISVWVKHIWHYSASCLRVCCGGEDSNESVVTACRVALQESWYTDTGSPGFSGSSPLDSSKSNAASRSVIYLSPAAPSYLRRWLSLNLCCSGLLITVLPAEDNSILPIISVPRFERIIQNDLHLGRQPLLLVTYAGSTLTGASDCLPTLAGICHRHKIWLHVEGLSLLRMALLANPPIKPSWVTTINSINLELSLCFGLPHSLNILLMQSKLPESILHYLNVFPLTKASEETEGETSPLPRSLPSTCLSNTLFAWFALRVKDGSHVNRIRHADHLTMYTLKKLQSLPLIETFPSHRCLGITASNGDRDPDTFFIKMLYDNSVYCPIILFRYVLSSSSQKSAVRRKSSMLSNSKTVDDTPVKARCMSESLVACVDEVANGPMDQRFSNSLNHWLASALQFEYPSLSIKTHFLPNGKLVLRFSLLDSVNLMAITDGNIDALVDTINLNCTIMEATWREKSAFYKLINCTPGLYYYYLPDWAGLGAALYVPHTYRCLLPDAGELSPSEYQNHLSNSLLRLPAKAAHDICELNRELISRLRSHDYAFSSARINFKTPPGVCEALESLASRTATRQSPNVALVNGGGEGESEECRESGGAPISQMQFHCLRFGLITPGTDTSEMVQMVLRMANVVEEDSNYVSSLSEVVKRGIEEATLHMKEERTKIMREQGVLRQVPYLEKLINWWSPPISTQIHGQMLNLSIGELVPTDSILPVSSSPPAEQDQSGEDTSRGGNKASTSIWSWLFPFS